MYWSDFLDHANGVMVFEGMENSRMTPPMTDKAGSVSFRNSQKKQMDSIWDMMFPRSAEFDKETLKRLDTFKKNKGTYKRIQDDINRERGIK